MNKVLIGPSDVTKQALLHICFVKSEVASVNVRSLNGNAREGCVQFPCPLWVKSGHVQCKRPCPLCPRKRTCAVHSPMSALCQKRTWRRASVQSGKGETAKNLRIGARSPSVCESHHRVHEHGGAGLEMLGPGLLAHVVAQATDTRYKYHPGRADTGHHLRVVAGAGRQAARGQGEVTRSRLHQRDDLGRKCDRLEACEAAGRDRYAPIAGEPSQRAGKLPVCTENLIHLDEVAELPKLAQ